MTDKVDIEKLIAKFLLGDITDLEKEQLDNWIQSSPKHESFFNRLRTSTSFRQRYDSYAQINSADAWKCFKRRYCSSPFIYIARVAKYAAVLILPALLITSAWYFFSMPEKGLVDSFASTDTILPGVPQATLTVSSDNSHALTATTLAPIRTSQTSTAIAQRGTLIYPASYKQLTPDEEQVSAKVVEKNTLTTQQGNEFRVTFEDGTSVHLNYNTQLRYPVKFNKSDRTVYLKGEAYFKVAKDTRPFYVVTDNGSIKQYGTEFNVNTFTPNRTEVVLVKGSISVIPKKANKEYLIKPGQLAYTDSEDDKISIRNVDILPYIAWNEGRLIFEDRSLESIVEILEHWYNVKISFGTPELKQLRFTGNMDRYGTITPILKAIARTTNLHIYVEGRSIMITEY